MDNDSYDNREQIEAAKRLCVELMYARLAELRAPLPPPPLWLSDMDADREALYQKHHAQWLKLKEEDEKWEAQLPQIRDRRIALEAKWEKLKARLENKS